MEEAGLVINNRELIYLYEPWMIWIFISTMALWAIYRVQFPGYIQLGKWNFSHYRIAKQVFSEGEFGIRIDWLIGFPIMSASIALFLFLAQITQTPCWDGFGNYMTLFGIVTLVFLVKMLVIAAIDTFSSKEIALRVYFGNTVILSQIAAFLLLFLSIVMALTYGNPSSLLIWIGLFILLISYLIRLTRGIIAAIQERISLNYLILYLCTLEILPLAVLIKAWMSMNISC